MSRGSSDSLYDLGHAHHQTTPHSVATKQSQNGHGTPTTAGRDPRTWGLGAEGMGPLTWGIGGDSAGRSPGTGPSSMPASGRTSPAFMGSAAGGSKTRVETEAEAKRRKIQRACDVCRRKKIKCDGPMNSLSTSKCAHCQEYGNDCTYVEAAKRRGPAKGYMEAVEQRCGRLERIFQQLHPGVDLTEYIGPMIDRDEFEQTAYADSLKSHHIPPYPQIKPLGATLCKVSSESSTTTSPAPSLASPASGIASSASTILGPAPWQTYERDPSRPPDDTSDNCELDAAEHSKIAEAMNRLDIHDGSWRYHGKASLAHMIRLFNSLKYKRDSSSAAFLERVAGIKRAEYWQVPEWEVVVANEGVRPVDYSVWPAPGLDVRLIDAYFDKVNIYLPLLNRIIFMRQYEAGSYKSSHEFAKVCLMVFANGARFIDDDERVFWPRDWAMTEEGKERLKGDTDGTIKYSGGWIYMRALMRMGRSIAQGPNLYDFQTQVLVCAFMQGAAVPHLMWVLSGLGLRSAQEIGIHVRSTLMLANPVERALYNRAFWCLYHIDRVNCAAIGRSVALQDTDFDADYPIPVDDEYWTTGNPETDFVQPEGAGLPKVASFIHMLKLDHVLGAALRTIYAIHKDPEHSADTASQRAVVVELDSALNAWADSVPDGLRWDPTRENQMLFEQSAMLYSQYYLCQILIHRPFIPTPQKPETIGLPSLAICSNAARSIANILDALIRRGRRFGALPGQAVNIHFLLPAWTAAVILLVSIYSAKQQKGERERAMMDVKRCIAATKEMEMTWRQAGKLTDVLMELSSEQPDSAGGKGQGRGKGSEAVNEDYGPPPVVSRHGAAKRPVSEDDGDQAIETHLATPSPYSSGASDLRKTSSSSSLSSKHPRSTTGSGSSLRKVSTPADIGPDHNHGHGHGHGQSSRLYPLHNTNAPSTAPPSRPLTPPNPWLPSQHPSQPTPILYGATAERNPSLAHQSGSQIQISPVQVAPNPNDSFSPYNPFAQPSTISSASQPYTPYSNTMPETYTNSSLNLTPVPGLNAGQIPGDEMLWDASFMDALNPELFGMGDMGGGSRLNDSGMAGAGGMGGMGGDNNVDDLWAQLFGANSQGLWTPGPSQGGPLGGGGASGSGFGAPGAGGSGQAY